MTVQPPTELHKFPKLCEDMRYHVLSFADSKTLLNYSQCSEECNKDVQKHRTKAPEDILIHRTCDGINVVLGYKPDADLYAPNSVGVVYALFKHADFSSREETMRKVEAYIVEAFKHVKRRTTRSLVINLDKWPTSLMNRGYFPVVEGFVVYVHNTMFDEFVDFAKTTEMRPASMSLHDRRDEIPISGDKMGEVFRFELFQQAEHVHVKTDAEITDDDLFSLANQNVHLELKHRVITNEGIRKKVDQINNSLKPHELSVRIDSSSFKFEFADLYPNNEVHQPFWPFGTSTWNEIRVGAVTLRTRIMCSGLIMSKPYHGRFSVVRSFS